MAFRDNFQELLFDRPWFIIHSFLKNVVFIVFCNSIERMPNVAESVNNISITNSVNLCKFVGCSNVHDSMCTSTESSFY